jgi:putative transferase (TIGR04331 family)
MKKYFKVSNLNPIGPDESVVLISEFLKDNFRHQRSIEILGPTFNSQNELSRLASVCIEKYESYTKILAQRLNLIHKTSYDIAYWQKALNLSFLRYITLLYDFYALLKKNFNPEQFQYSILKEEDFYVPISFEDQRALIQNSLFGNEQIFSLFVRFFYTSLASTEISIKFEINKKPSRAPLKNFILERLKSISRGNNSLMIRCKRLALEIFDYLFVGRAAVFGTYFSAENLNALLKVRTIVNLGYPNFGYTRTQQIDINARDIVSKPLGTSDEFDDFFFFTLRYLLPKIIIEDYQNVHQSIRSFFRSTGKLKFIISEVWLANSHACLALAYLHQKRVVHIYNEHNALFHPFVGGLVDFIAKHTDRYFNLGWKPTSENKKIIRGASLYKFNQGPKQSTNGRILYISGPYQYKMPNYSSLYSLCGDYFVTNHLNFLDSFFKGLETSNKMKIDYRPYPSNYDMDILLFNKEDLLREHLTFSKVVNDFKVKANAIMTQYDLVILDYISTSLIESLVSKCPTIFFHPSNNYFLDPRYNRIFKDLEDVGICQTHPLNAANFINQNISNIMLWWNKNETQSALNQFLEQNIGDPEEAVSYYKNL